MAVYHYTFHAYGTWKPDHPRGYVIKGEGILPTDEDMAELYEDQQKFSTVQFDRPMQEVLISGAHDICTRRNWRLHAVGTDRTHVHFLISWRQFVEWIEVRNKLKNLLSLFLGRLKKEEGRRWFVVDGSRKRVETKDHFDHLIQTYLPNHRGVFWKEGNPLPTIPDGIL